MSTTSSMSRWKKPAFWAGLILGMMLAFGGCTAFWWVGLPVWDSWQSGKRANEQLEASREIAQQQDYPQLREAELEAAGEETSAQLAALLAQAPAGEPNRRGLLRRAQCAPEGSDPEFSRIEGRLTWIEDPAERWDRDISAEQVLETAELFAERLQADPAWQVEETTIEEEQSWAARGALSGLEFEIRLWQGRLESGAEQFQVQVETPCYWIRDSQAETAFTPLWP